MAETETKAVESTEKAERKTMLNCSNIEFIKQANAIKGDVEKFVAVTGINKIRAEQIKYEGSETEEEKEQLQKAFAHKKWDKILVACFAENTDLTMKLIAKMCFTTVEELEKMTPQELEATAVLLLADSRINDFFISLKVMGLFATG